MARRTKRELRQLVRVHVIAYKEEKAMRRDLRAAMRAAAERVDPDAIASVVLAGGVRALRGLLPDMREDLEPARRRMIRLYERGGRIGEAVVRDAT